MKYLGVLLLSGILTGLGAYAHADSTCQIDGDFRLRDFNNINHVTSTRLSGAQQCIGQPILKKFKKSNGEYGTDLFRQVRLENGRTLWVAEKGVSQPQVARPSVSAPVAVTPPPPRPRPTAPKVVSTVDAPTAFSASQFKVEEGFRLRSTPNASNNQNVVGSTQAADQNLQLVYTNGSLDIKNGYVKANYGGKEVWVHESALSPAALPAFPMTPPVRPAVASVEASVPALKPATVHPQEAELHPLALPRVDPALQRAVDQKAAEMAQAQARARVLEETFKNLPQVDPALKRAAEKKAAEAEAEAAARAQAEEQKKLPAPVTDVVASSFNNLPTANSSLQAALEKKAAEEAAKKAAAVTPAALPPPPATAAEASASGNGFFNQIKDSNWGRAGNRRVELYDQPGVEGHNKLGLLSSQGRYGVFELKRINENGHDVVWLKIVPFDCDKVNLSAEGDPALKPDDSCNQAYWIKSSAFLPAERPGAQDFALRAAPESYTEAGGICLNCGLDGANEAKEIQAAAAAQ
jgi:hypothetical protein